MKEIINEPEPEHFTTAVELSRLILNPDMSPAVENTFQNNTTASALLRHYYLLSMNCNRLREDFIRHIRE